MGGSVAPDERLPRSKRDRRRPKYADTILFRVEGFFTINF